MYQLQASSVFDDWLRTLRDQNARARVLARLESAENGNLGDVKAVGDGIREMRIPTAARDIAFILRRRERCCFWCCARVTSPRSLVTSQRRAEC